MSAVISDNPDNDRTMHRVRRASGMSADQSPNDHLKQSRGRTLNSHSFAPTHLRLPTQYRQRDKSLSIMAYHSHIYLIPTVLLGIPSMGDST